MYENIHTGKICSIERVEVVNNPPITVYVLSSGQRWRKEQFDRHWRRLIVYDISEPGSGQRDVTDEQLTPNSSGVTDTRGDRLDIELAVFNVNGMLMSLACDVSQGMAVSSMFNIGSSTDPA